MTESRQAHEALCSALQDYARADTEDKQARAVLSLQGGMDKALRAYLARLGCTDVDSRSVNYPALVDLVRDRTPLFAGDQSLPGKLVSLNNTRIRIAHPELNDVPSPDEISHDARQYVNLIRRFWPTIFGEAFPEALLAAPEEPAPAPEPVHHSPPEPPPEPPRPASPRRPRVRPFLRKIWSDESTPRLQRKLLFKRVIGIIIFLVLARLCKEAAIFTARWPEPIKYGGIVLFILAMASFAWGLILIWKVLRQIRLKGVLIFFVVTYVLLLSAVVLTSASSLPWYQEAWQITQDWAGLAGRTVVDTADRFSPRPRNSALPTLGTGTLYGSLAWAQTIPPTSRPFRPIDLLGFQRDQDQRPLRANQPLPSPKALP